MEVKLNFKERLQYKIVPYLKKFGRQDNSAAQCAGTLPFALALTHRELVAVVTMVMCSSVCKKPADYSTLQTLLMRDVETVREEEGYTVNPATMTAYRLYVYGLVDKDGYEVLRSTAMVSLLACMWNSLEHYPSRKERAAMILRLNALHVQC